MIGNKVEYIQAYTELGCLLKYFPKDYIKKLPNKLLNLIDRNSKDEFKINVDFNGDLRSVKLSKQTYNLLAVLKYNYWSTEDEKESIRKNLNENEMNFQKELTEKYDIQKFMKKQNTEVDDRKELVTTEYKENLFVKIINKIKKFFSYKK